MANGACGLICHPVQRVVEAVLSQVQENATIHCQKTWEITVKGLPGLITKHAMTRSAQVHK